MNKELENYPYSTVVVDNYQLRDNHLEFFYCVYKGIVKESRFMLQDTMINKSFYNDAITAYRHDPYFHRLYDLNFQLCEYIIEERRDEGKW